MTKKKEETLVPKGCVFVKTKVKKQVPSYSIMQLVHFKTMERNLKDFEDFNVSIVAKEGESYDASKIKTVENKIVAGMAITGVGKTSCCN